MRQIKLLYYRNDQIAAFNIHNAPVPTINICDFGFIHTNLTQLIRFYCEVLKVRLRKYKLSRINDSGYYVVNYIIMKHQACEGSEVFSSSRTFVIAAFRSEGVLHQRSSRQ